MTAPTYAAKAGTVLLLLLLLPVLLPMAPSCFTAGAVAGVNKGSSRHLLQTGAWGDGAGCSARAAFDPSAQVNNNAGATISANHPPSCMGPGRLGSWLFVA